MKEHDHYQNYDYDVPVWFFYVAIFIGIGRYVLGGVALYGIVRMIVLGIK